MSARNRYQEEQRFSMAHLIHALPLFPLDLDPKLEQELIDVLQTRRSERYRAKQRAGEVNHGHYWSYDFYGDVFVSHDEPHAYTDDNHTHPNEEAPERPEGSHPWDF